MSVVKRNKHTSKDTIKVSRSVKFLLCNDTELGFTEGQDNADFGGGGNW